MFDWQQILKQASYPKTAIVVDFETYFDKDYSLKKMSTIEFVKDARFEVIGLGCCTAGATSSPAFYAPNEIPSRIEILKKQLQNGATIVCQNSKFDCLILQEHYGITPKYTVDLIDIERIWESKCRHSLEAMAKRWGASTLKGDTDQFKGYRWADMSPEMRIALQEYCKNDIEIELFLFQLLLPIVPNPYIELPLATQTLHLYLKPQIVVDYEVGKELKKKMRLEALKPRLALRNRKICSSKKFISGNKSFKALLEKYLPDGESVPMKQGKKGLIPTLAKDDEGFRCLLEHSEENIRLLAQARQAVKSWPLHIKRVDNLMNQARANGGRIGAPLGYYAAHTGRWGGREGINLQNLGNRGRKGAGTHPLIRAIRRMLLPDTKGIFDKLFGKADYSQIEFRVLAWFAGQTDLLQAFADGRDVYSEFATESLFKEPVRKPIESDSLEVAQILTFKRGFAKDGMLGFGYGLGTNRLYTDCRANDSLRPAFDSGEYDWSFIKRLIEMLRKRYDKIPAFWRKVEKNWRFVTKYPGQVASCHRPNYEHIQEALYFCNKDNATFIVLPSGRYLRYPRAKVNKHGDCSYKFGSLWGGSITENIVQATARDLFAEALLRLEVEKFNIVTHTHDDIITLLHKTSAEKELQRMMNVMKVIPPWAEGLPVEVEGELKERFGD